MRDGIRNITLKMEALTKKATVVDTGRLRASITHKITQRSGIVGTNVKYAEFVEYGTVISNPPHKGRHMEGALKRFGLGMFGYALEKLKQYLDKAGGSIARDIERKF
jgi:phage gpG-like protein